MVETAKVFRSGNSQAVRLPKAFRLDVDEVEISREGEAIVLRPLARSPVRWSALHAAVERGFSEDFEADRGSEPAEAQQRDDLDGLFR